MKLDWIPTPTGFAAPHELCAGDRVFAGNGVATKIKSVLHIERMEHLFHVPLSDGTFVEYFASDVWMAFDPDGEVHWITVENLREYPEGYWALPLGGPVEFESTFQCRHLSDPFDANICTAAVDQRWLALTQILGRDIRDGGGRARIRLRHFDAMRRLRVLVASLGGVCTIRSMTELGRTVWLAHVSVKNNKTKWFDTNEPVRTMGHPKGSLRSPSYPMEFLVDADSYLVNNNFVPVFSRVI